MRWFPMLIVAASLPLGSLRAAEDAKGRIVYACKEGEAVALHVMNADGTGDRKLNGPTAPYAVFPTWSPDGKRIAYTAATDLQKADGLQVCVVNADGTDHRALALNTRIAALPAFSPDGQQLAFAAGDDQPQIFTSDLNGNAQKQVSKDGRVAFFPFWADGGKKLGYTRIRDEGPQLVLTTLEDGAEEILAKSEPGKIVAAGPNCLSPDGKRILYVIIDEQANTASLVLRDLATKSDAFLSDLDFGTVIGPQGFPAPAWAPDGKSFLTRLKSEKGDGLFRVSDDGKTKTRLTPEGVTALSGAWTAGS